MVTEVGFYHCTRMPVVTVGVRLLGRAYAGGLRALVTGDPGLLDALDLALWADTAESFLPHALAGTAEDSEQPILLSPVAEDAANGATLLLSLAAGVPPTFTNFARVLNLFEDGSDAHKRARNDWKALADRSDVARTYWQQKEGGGWERKA